MRNSVLGNLKRNDDPEKGRVWLESESGKVVSSINVDQLGPIQAMNVGDQIALAWNMYGKMKAVLERVSRTIPTNEGLGGYAPRVEWTEAAWQARKVLQEIAAAH